MNGVLFGNKHSYKDWGLLLTERPKVSPAEVKSSYVDIPGANGDLDLTEVMTKDVKYKDREITCKFHVLADRSKWHEIYSTIQDYVHGQAMKIILDEDPCYYYTGRCAVDNWESSKVKSTIVIKAKVAPYKDERFSSLEPWEWDTFNFETGIIRDYKDIVVEGTHVLNIDGTRKQVVPTFTTEGEVSVEFNGKSYNLPIGTSRILNIVIVEGQNLLTFKGQGKVSVEYRGGRL